jgi:hypothetical protein
VNLSPMIPAAPQPKRPWFKATWFTIILLVLFFPVGLVLMWMFRSWKLWIKASVTAIFGIAVVASAASGGSGSSSSVAALPATTSTSASATNSAPLTAPAVVVAAVAATPTTVPPTHVPPTTTPLPPTPTRVPATATAVPPTATASPSKDAAVSIDPRKLGADPTSYVGQNITLTGLARNVQQYDKSEKLFGVVRADYTWTDFVSEVPGRQDVVQEMVAYWFPKNPDILKGNMYKIWAIVRGSEEAQIIQTGATVSEPDVEVYAYQELPSQ